MTVELLPPHPPLDCRNPGFRISNQCLKLVPPVCTKAFCNSIRQVPAPVFPPALLRMVVGVSVCLARSVSYVSIWDVISSLVGYMSHMLEEMI